MTQAKSVTVVIPVYRDVPATVRCIESCLKHIDARHKILIVNDAGPEPDMERAIIDAMRGHAQVFYHRNDENLGFVKTCNTAVLHDDSDNDILLLNSDTVVTEGFLEEMLACLYAAERHAVCCPRSDHRVTVLTVEGPDSFARWKAMQPHVERYTIVPTGVGFCLLIKRSVIKDYGLFDEAYGRGYNEENDFCARINRYGFTTVMANRAFVFHEGNKSFTPQEKTELDKKNGELLRMRHPSYWTAHRDYHRFLLPATQRFLQGSPQTGRPALAIDLSRLPAAHSGTTQYILELLPRLLPLLRQWCDVTILVNPACDAFFGFSRLYPDITRMYTDAGEDVFDMVFVPFQIFSFEHLSFLNSVSKRIVVTMHDVIALRTMHLRTMQMEYACRLSMVHIDGIIAISDAAYADVSAYVPAALGPLPETRVIRHGLDFRHAAPEELSSDLPDKYVLLLGNAFKHKRVQEGLAALPEELPVVVIGNAHKISRKNMHVLPSGKISPGMMAALYERCAFVFVPSSYEGFGFPVIHAALAGKAVLSQDMPVNRELRETFGLGAHFHLFQQMNDVAQTARELWNAPSPAKLQPTRLWTDCAEDTNAFLRTLVDKPMDWHRLERRYLAISALEVARSLEYHYAFTPWQKFHRFVGHGLNRWPRLKRIIQRAMALAGF